MTLMRGFSAYTTYTLIRSEGNYNSGGATTDDQLAQFVPTAVRVRARGDLLESASSYSGAEALLADSFSEGYGGSGKAFEWTWVPAPHERRLPLIMSGGLDAGSVTEAIARVAPTGVDVSSGIQGSDPRTKEWAKMERFVAAVIGADAMKAGHGPDTGR